MSKDMREGFPPTFAPDNVIPRPSSVGAQIVGGHGDGQVVHRAASVSDGNFKESLLLPDIAPDGSSYGETVQFRVTPRDVLGSAAVIATGLTFWVGGVLLADIDDQRFSELEPAPGISAIQISDGAVLRDDRFAGLNGLFLGLPSWTDRKVIIPKDENGEAGTIIINAPNGVQITDGGTYQDYDYDGILKTYDREWYSLSTSDVIASLELLNTDGQYNHVIEGLRHDMPGNPGGDGVTNVASDLASTIPWTFLGED